ncbi:FHA domain-containing protein [Pseudoflavonifractor capillosus]|uniref:FHA domain-containing protein n=1 Tax=Pseudoflavonifractor capillosus TaxID=106588 RepID=UPI00195C0A6A|nr:FHA domain-containing protein [Pseudoflavonifractor capillosus]MBM6694905.1 FHA domain-containing protein [Pseudoflavonifractor capillosus]
MNTLVEKQYVKELVCGSNFSYILAEGGLFSATEYKVLQSQASGCFVQCMKMLYNGNIQIYYLANQLKPFANLIPSLDPERFMAVVINLLGNILKVRNNGFLNCQKIDVSFEHIYVNPITLNVGLVYLPVNHTIYPDQSSFENEIRTGLIKLISGVSNLQSPATMQLSMDLSNGTLSIEDLYRRYKGGEDFLQEKDKLQGKSKHTVSLCLTAMYAPTRVEIRITKDRFVLGKKAGAVDGVISFNDKISRIHCRIDRKGERYTITDLQSANGTYVNGKRLQANQPYRIGNGDIIRMANSDFQVSTR